MVVCKYCPDTRLVTRSLTMKDVEEKINPNDDLRPKADPTVLELWTRCKRCNRRYRFTRIITSDEMQEAKKLENCCGG